MFYQKYISIKEHKCQTSIIDIYDAFSKYINCITFTLYFLRTTLSAQMLANVSFTLKIVISKTSLVISITIVIMFIHYDKMYFQII